MATPNETPAPLPYGSAAPLPNANAMPKTPPPVPNASGGGVSPGPGVTPGAASHGSAGGADGLSPMAIEKRKQVTAQLQVAIEKCSGDEWKGRCKCLEKFSLDVNEAKAAVEDSQAQTNHAKVQEAEAADNLVKARQEVSRREGVQARAGRYFTMMSSNYDDYENAFIRDVRARTE